MGLGRVYVCAHTGLLEPISTPGTASPHVCRMWRTVSQAFQKEEAQAALTKMARMAVTDNR